MTDRDLETIKAVILWKKTIFGPNYYQKLGNKICLTKMEIRCAGALGLSYLEYAELKADDNYKEEWKYLYEDWSS